MFSAEGEFLTIWDDIKRPMDISVDQDGMFHVSEGVVDDAPARFSVLDGEGKVLSRFEIRGSGHGSWGDAHGDIYVVLPAPGGVDKLIRQS